MYFIGIPSRVQQRVDRQPRVKEQPLAVVLVDRVQAPKVTRTVARRCHVKVYPQLNQVRGHPRVRNQKKAVARSVIPGLGCDDPVDRHPLGVGTAAGEELCVRLDVERVGELGQMFLFPYFETCGKQIPII